jgi:hypothetical protein
VLSVVFYLLAVATAFGLIGMADIVGADWPNWSSNMVLVCLTFLPATWVLTGISAGVSKLARWFLAVGIAACVLRVVWSLYDAGTRALYAGIAVAPFLVLLLLAVLLLAYAWPRSVAAELAEVAQANGWQSDRELPKELIFPTSELPLPVGRATVVRNVVRTPEGIAFEVRWLEWHGPLVRRKRLAVFVGRQLAAKLPPLEVRPGNALTRSDLSLESAEFNRSFDVLGEDSRYVMAMLHPRAMQILLDGRPLGLVVAGDALAAYDPGGLDAASLIRGMATIQRLQTALPRHVLDQWGSYRGTATSSRLRFAGPPWSSSLGGFLLRLVALSTGLLGATLAACLLAATAEKHATGIDFEPAQPLRALVISAVVLIAVAIVSGLASRPRPAQGSSVA